MQYFPYFMPEGCIEAADLAVFSSAFSWFLRERFSFDELVLYSCDGNGNLTGCERDLDREALMIAWEMKTVRTLPSGRLLIPLAPEGRLLGVAVARADRAGGRQNAHALEREAGAMVAALSHLRTFLLDPFTGLGNANFFLDQLRTRCTAGSSGSIFFVKLRPQSARDDDAELFRQAGGILLECLAGEAGLSLPAYLGSGIFALLLCDRDAAACQKLAHDLVEECRRRKLKQAVIGMVVLDATKGGIERHLLDLSWNALQDAEQRSTFAVVDARAQNAVQAFSLPDFSATKELLAAHKKQSIFACIAVADDSPDNAFPPLDETLSAMTDVPVLGDDPYTAYLVLPGADEKRARDWAVAVQRALMQPDQTALTVSARPVSIGVALYPDASFRKGDILLNARKALLHARFFAPAGLVFFDHVSLNVSGDIFFNEGHHFSAVKEYRLGLEKQKNDVNLRNSLGVTCAHMNRHREAMHEFARVLEIAPADFMALANSGLSSLALDAPDKAMVYFSRALDTQSRACPSRSSAQAGVAQDSDSALFDIVLHLARLLHMDGRLEEALVLLDSWISDSLNPIIKGKMLVLRGEILQDGDDFRAASKCFQEALLIFPKDANIMSLLGESFAWMGEDRQVAFSLGMAAVSAEPLRAEFWRRHGAACLPYGDLEGAATFLQKAFDLNPDDPRTLLRQGELERSRGKKSKAAAIFRRISVRKKIPAVVRTRVEKLLATCESRQVIIQEVLEEHHGAD